MPLPDRPVEDRPGERRSLGRRSRRRAAASGALVLLLAALAGSAGSTGPAGPAVAAVATADRATPAPVALASFAAPGPDEPCRGTVSLTFDDGPVPGATDELLRVLDELDAPATFFMIGRRVDAHPALARAVAAAGYPIGNHTYAHEDLTTLNPVQIRSTFVRAAQALERAGATSSTLVRLPFGRSNATIERMLRRGDVSKVGWNSPAHDGGGAPAAANATQLALRVLGKLRHDRANVVLQHDGGPDAAQTIRAVPLIVDSARARGYCVVGLGPDGRPLR